MQNTKVNIKQEEVEISYATDLYVAGRRCDGHDQIAEVFYLTATFKDGTVYAHYHRVRGCKVEVNEFAYGEDAFIDVCNEARTWCEKMVEKIKAAGEIDLLHWEYHRTVYGSHAYQSFGGYEELMLEQKEG